MTDKLRAALESAFTREGATIDDLSARSQAARNKADRAVRAFYLEHSRLITQSNLAKLIGCPPSRVTAALYGKHVPKPEKIEAKRAALEWAADLIERMPAPIFFEPGDVRNMLARHEIRKIVNQLKNKAKR